MSIMLHITYNYALQTYVVHHITSVMTTVLQKTCR